MSMNTVSVSLPASTLPSTLAILINTPLSPAPNTFTVTKVSCYGTIGAWIRIQKTIDYGSGSVLLMKIIRAENILILHHFGEDDRNHEP